MNTFLENLQNTINEIRNRRGNKRNAHNIRFLEIFAKDAVSNYI